LEFASCARDQNLQQQDDALSLRQGDASGNIIPVA
jgi:hypothetical protein